MRICYIANGDSPIARNWIKTFVDEGHDIHVISTRNCDLSDLSLSSLHIINLYSLRHTNASREVTSSKLNPSSISAFRAYINKPALLHRAITVRNIFAALRIFYVQQHVRDIIFDINPEIVHAMRIPLEGMLGAVAHPNAPLLMSVWGNDFTFHAPSNALMSHLTKLTMRRASALHADCTRDVRLAIKWGFKASKPTIVLPGNGGVDRSIFHPVVDNAKVYRALDLPLDHRVVINPRGFRPYVCNDAFFRAIPYVLTRYPRTTFICSAMEDQPVAEKWVRELGIEGNVRLLPVVHHSQMAQYFRLAEVAVSPSLHDGTPNTLLEAMACGCFPVAGNIESIREWINDGENGLLCDPSSSLSISSAIIRALEDRALVSRAKEINENLINQRAESLNVASEAESFYERVVYTAKHKTTT